MHFLQPVLKTKMFSISLNGRKQLQHRGRDRYQRAQWLSQPARIAPSPGSALSVPAVILLPRHWKTGWVFSKNFCNTSYML